MLAGSIGSKWTLRRIDTNVFNFVIFDHYNHMRVFIANRANEISWPDHASCLRTTAILNCFSWNPLIFVTQFVEGKVPLAKIGVDCEVTLRVTARTSQFKFDDVKRSHLEAIFAKHWEKDFPTSSHAIHPTLPAASNSHYGNAIHQLAITTLPSPS